MNSVRERIRVRLTSPSISSRTRRGSRREIVGFDVYVYCLQYMHCVPCIRRAVLHVESCRDTGARLAPVAGWTAEKADPCSLGTDLPKASLSCTASATHPLYSASRTNLWRGRPK